MPSQQAENDLLARVTYALACGADRASGSEASPRLLATRAELELVTSGGLGGMNGDQFSRLLAAVDCVAVWSERSEDHQQLVATARDLRLWGEQQGLVPVEFERERG